MKKSTNHLSAAPVKDLYAALALLKTSKEVEQFLMDLCTPAELTAMADRWAVVPQIIAGKPYRQIHDETRVSITTIGRVARSISYGTGGYQQAYQLLRGSYAKSKSS